MKLKYNQHYSSFIPLILSFIIFCCIANAYAQQNKQNSFTKFQTGFEQKADKFIIKGYLREKSFVKSEYTYEQFEISFPANIEINKEYNINNNDFAIFYAVGSEGGQIETKTAKGTCKLISKSNKNINITLDLILSNFQLKGHMMNIPKEITLKGILNAKKDLKVY